MVILSRCPLDLLSAQTVRMPFTSMSKVTVIFGFLAGAGAMPIISKQPSRWLSAVRALSPSYTWMSTSLWLSTAVEKTFSARVGMVVLRGMRTVMMPPAVCRPRDSGVTSSSTRSLIRSSISWVGLSPGHSRAACTAAPIATASSGLMPWHNGRPPKNSDRTFRTLGTLVEPPTSTTSCTCSPVMPASARTCCTGCSIFSSRSSISPSNTSLVRVTERSRSRTSVSMCTSVCRLELRARLACSAAVRSLLMALGLSLTSSTSIPCVSENSRDRYSTRRSSKSSPPR
mmetsp:Transcript_11302/g.32070  ORF Transcript_11302/g.32070 Transcript_11302/m.32070 type:complete len:286 (-) Transcript_11302:1415-2272(-)